MRHLDQLGNRFSIPINPDRDGYIGRECPLDHCLGYFKVTSGTGVQGDPFCYCPYCGHRAEHDKFWTREQIEYAESVVINKVTGALLKDFKSLEFNHPARGAFGIGISMTVTGTPTPIRHYREKQLETEIVCDRCTLRYAIYGVFAFCPDCGAHNSHQILEKNLELAAKEIALAGSVEGELSNHLVADALENVVSAFDGFGREICRVNALSALTPSKAESLSFQNLVGARKRVQELFSFDISSAVGASEWELACRCFQKRHLLAHKMGVVDEAYVRATKDPASVVGRKISITSEEVTELADVVRNLGAHLTSHFERLRTSSSVEAKDE